MSRRGRTKRERERAKRTVRVTGPIEVEALEAGVWRMEKVEDQEAHVLYRRVGAVEVPAFRIRQT